MDAQFPVPDIAMQYKDDATEYVLHYKNEAWVIRVTRQKDAWVASINSEEISRGVNPFYVLVRALTIIEAAVVSRKTR